MNKQQRHINKVTKRLMNKAFRLFCQSKLNKAIELYDKIIELNPNNAKAYKGRADVNFIIEPEKAIQDSTKAIELKPNYISAYKIRALTNSLLLYNEENTTILDYKAVISDYTTILEYNPNYFDAYDLRGGIYHDTEQYNLAIKDYTKAIELKPQISRLYIYRGKDYLSIQDYDNAIKDFTSATNSDFFIIEADGYHYLAKTYYLLKDYNQAISFYTQAIEIYKGNYNDTLIKHLTALYKSRSEIYRLLGETEKADKDLTLSEAYAASEEDKTR